MKIGCPTEIKPQEFRVGMTPNAALEAVAHGHDVIVQAGAGKGAGFEDADYVAAGAAIICRGWSDYCRQPGKRGPDGDPGPWRCLNRSACL